MPRCNGPLMVTHIDGREEQVDHHYQLVVRGKDEKDAWVYAYSVSRIWDFAPPGELPDNIGDRTEVAKGGPSEQPAGPIDMVIGCNHAELLPRCCGMQ